MTDKKIEILKAELHAGNYAFDDASIAFIIGCIKKAGLDKAEIVKQTTTVAPTAVVVQKTKKLTGYNIFMKEKMAEFKEKGMPVSERMGAVSVAWKGLKPEEKSAWSLKADKEEPVVVNAKANPAKKGPKSMTGYQFFVQEQMPTVKLNKTIEPTKRMTELGRLWKLLDKAAQADYKTKAAVVSPPPIKA